jgi:hypothetical protein
MSLSTLATLAGAHAKTAAAVLAVSAATGGGLAVATTVANSHAAPGLANAQAATASAHPTPSASASDAAVAGTTAGTTTAPTGTSSPVTCDNAKNHGAYVSSVAHATPSGTAPNAHGKAVSAAAQSSCGKKAGAGDSTGTSGSGDATDSSDAGDSGEANDSGDGGKPTSVPTHAPHSKHSGHQPGH